MEIILKCSACKEGIFVFDRPTHRRIIYRCTECGRELAVKKARRTPIPQ